MEILNLEKFAKSTAENLSLAKSAFDNFYFNVVKELGELPLQGSNKEIKGLRIITTTIPFGKKGLETVRAASVTYDKVRYNGITKQIEFHVTKGGGLFLDNTWQTRFDVDFLTEISDCLFEAIVFPKETTIVDFYNS